MVSFHNSIIILVWSKTKKFNRTNLFKQINKDIDYQNQIHSLLYQEKEDIEEDNTKYNNLYLTNKVKVKKNNLFSDKYNSLITSIKGIITSVNKRPMLINKFNTAVLKQAAQKINYERKLNDNRALNRAKSTDMIYTRPRSRSHIETYNEKQKMFLKNKNQFFKVFRNKTDDKLKNFIDININELYRFQYKKNVFNFERFNQILREELNKTICRFNPKNHIVKLNDLVRKNNLLREILVGYKKNIDNKLENIMNKKFSSKEILSETKNNSNTKNTNRINLKSSTENLAKKGKKSRLMTFFDTRREKISKMKSNTNITDKALRKLYFSLDSKNIEKYINDIKNTKEYKDKSSIQKNQNKYFPEINEVKDLIQEYKDNNSKKEITSIDQQQIQNNISNFKNLLFNIMSEVQKQV